MPDPRALTLVLPEATGYREEPWQTLVLEHLGLPPALAVYPDHEVDLVGEQAAGLIRRIGLLYPPNAITLLPMLDAVGSGTLLTGMGGDEVLSPGRWTPLLDGLARRRPLALRDVGRAAGAVLPPPTRRRWVARRTPAPDQPWLRPQARRAARAALITESDEPVRSDAAIRRRACERSVVLTAATIERLGTDRGIDVLSPLSQDPFVSSVARVSGVTGFGSRRAAMHAIAGDALPVALLDRHDKATVRGSFFGPASRSFAERWSGRGLDETLVDPDALRRVWLSDAPDYRASLLLQSAWLHDERTRERP